MWLYFSKDAARKVDQAISIAVDPRRGDFTKAVQGALAEMRKDLQLFSWQRIEPDDIQHVRVSHYEAMK